MNRGSFVIPMMVVFIALVLAAGACSVPRQEYNNTIWIISNSQQWSGFVYILPVITCIVIPLFVLISGTLSTMSSSVTPEQLIEIVVGNHTELIEDKFTNEEIENAPGSIRQKHVQEEVKRRRKDRRFAENWQFHTTEFDQEAYPEDKRQTYTGRVKIDKYLDGIRRMFRGASVRFSMNILSGQDLEFSKRGRHQLEMSCNRRGDKYRVILLHKSKYERVNPVEVYEGSAAGAVEVVQKWYRGEKLRGDRGKMVDTVDEDY